MTHICHNDIYRQYLPVWRDERDERDDVLTGGVSVAQDGSSLAKMLIVLRVLICFQMWKVIESVFLI
jgi:hypothetical protein